MAENAVFASPLVILLTSTIRPPSAATAAIQDRRRQYEEALEFWFLHPDPRLSGIVYCDNSTSDLAWAHALADHFGFAGRFEAIFCPDNRMPGHMHDGYPELGIVDHALRTSALLSQAPYFAKVTGRLRFAKFYALLDRLPSSFDACIDYRRTHKNERTDWSRFRARTQLMFFNKAFYERALMEKRSLMLEHEVTHLEEFIAGMLVPGDEECSSVVFRWPIECPPSGVGGNGEDYDSVKRRMKVLAQRCLRRFVPGVWR